MADIHELLASRKKPVEDDFYSTAGANREARNFVDFRFKTGDRMAFNYFELKWIGYDPDGPVLNLEFGDWLVSIEGKGLEPGLYDAFMDKRVAWVREAETDMEVNDSFELYVSQIIITPPEQAQRKTEGDAEAS